MATGQDARPPGAVQDPARAHLGAASVPQPHLHPPPLPVRDPFRQPRHAPHDLRPGFRRRPAQQRVKARTEDMEAGGAPREVVAAPVSAPQGRVAAVRLEASRFDHTQQARRGQNLARAGGQRLGQGVCGPVPGHAPADTPARLGGGPGPRRPLDEDDLVAPARQEPGRGRSRRAAAENEDLCLRVHRIIMYIMCNLFCTESKPPPQRGLSERQSYLSLSALAPLPARNASGATGRPHRLVD